jgi:hypothetical protein
MRPFLIFVPYVLVPLLFSLLFKWAKITWEWLSFLLRGITIYFYPYFLFWLNDYLNPPRPGPRCFLPEYSFFMGNIIIFIPVSLLIQFLFNRVFLKRKIVTLS